MTEQQGLGSPSSDPGRPGFARPARPGEPAANGPVDRPRPWPELPPRSPRTPTDPGRPSQPGQPVRPGRPVRRRRSRAPIVLLLVLVLLIAVVVVGDRLSVRAAERRVATSLQTELQTADPPQVEIDGVPFLTQLAGRDIRQVQVSTGPVPGNGQRIALQNLDLTLHDVRPNASFTSFRIDRLDGSTRISYADLGERVGQQIVYAGSDRIQLDVRTSALGQTITVRVSGRLGIDAAAQTLRLNEPQVLVAGVALPGALSSQLVANALGSSDLTGLPLGIRISALRAEPDGVAVQLAGQDLTVTER